MPTTRHSYLQTRSLTSTQIPHPPIPHSSLEHININTVDTPTNSLRSEILIGFLPIHPHSLITLSKPTNPQECTTSQSKRGCALRLWRFHPGRPVHLTKCLSVEEQPDYLPVAVASTCFDHQKEVFHQVIYRAATDDGEGCIEIRYLPLSGSESWSVWESVTEEDGILGGMCWNLLKGGYITVATASRVYFFTEGRIPEDLKEGNWTCGKRCLIFEVDLFLHSILGGRETRFATRLLKADNDKTVSILVFASQKTQLQSFKLEIWPHEQKVKLCAKTEIVSWKSGARGALLAWSMGRKVMMAHCCEDECGDTRDNGMTSIFKTWFARGEKRSLRELVWEYGGIIVDCWDT